MHAKGGLNAKCAWLADNQYGALLKDFCYGKVRASQAALFAIQGAFAEAGFPISDKQVPVILRVFELLYDRDVIAEDAMQAWRDDIRNPAPGHDKALMQTEP